MFLVEPWIYDRAPQAGHARKCPKMNKKNGLRRHPKGVKTFWAPQPPDVSTEVKERMTPQPQAAPAHMSNPNKQPKKKAYSTPLVEGGAKLAKDESNQILPLPRKGSPPEKRQEQKRMPTEKKKQGKKKDSLQEHSQRDRTTRAAWGSSITLQTLLKK